VLAAVLYGAVVARLRSKEKAFEWWSGYVLEWLLSLDNLFVFLLVFKAYRVPYSLQPKALACWIPIGILTRLAMFAILDTVFKLLIWVKVVGGIYVIYCAYVSASEEDESINISEFATVRFFHRLIGRRLEDTYDEKGGSLFIWKEDGVKATLLVLVVFSLVMVDIILAFDSVSAKVTEIPDKYIAMSSTMMALFGMRSFVVFLEDLVNMFEMLKYGIAGILAFVGFQLVISGLSNGSLDLSPTSSMLIVCSLLLCSILLSIVKMAFGADSNSPVPDTKDRNLATEREVQISA
jgi:tellurite resistance protein TerC